MNLFARRHLTLRCTLRGGLLNKALDINMRKNVLDRGFSNDGISLKRDNSPTFSASSMGKDKVSLDLNLCCRRGT